MQRLKIFYNTYVRESAVAGRASYNGKKLYFLKGSKGNPTNHDKLVYGQGKWGADFYFYDDSLPGTEARQKMVTVEMKHCRGSLAEAIAEYADNKFMYAAKYLVLAMQDGTYNVVNYTVNPAAVTKLDVVCEDAYRI